MTNRKQALEALRDRIDCLYRDLTKAFPHPFDWMGLLEKPPFWRWSWRKPHQKVAAIFEDHGFTLTPEVAFRYHAHFPDDWQFLAMDAGGHITAKLERALEPQTLISETPDTPKGETP